MKKILSLDIWKYLFDQNSRRVFNLYNEPEAHEYLFYKIILTYGEDVDNFNGPFWGPCGIIEQSQVLVDKDFFYKYLPKWEEEIKLKKGSYLNVITPMLNKKLKELYVTCKNDEEYHSREIIAIVSFSIHIIEQDCFSTRKRKNV